jgi:F0F1-type ATP synthase assembly protein I
MSRRPRKIPPLVAAYEWASRGTTVSAVFIAPALGGYWLDQRWGTSYLALIGAAIGFALGLWMIIRLAKDAEQAEQDESTTDESGR